MKAFLTTSLLLSIMTFGLSQSVGINVPSGLLDSSAILQIQSNDKGLLIPRMSTNQRNNIQNPANGLLVFDFSKGRHYTYLDSAWFQLNRDGDFSETNELQSVSQDGPTVTLSKGGGSFSIVDLDSDPNNEMQSLSIFNDTIFLTGGGKASINDLDSDPNNEMQSLSLINDTLFLTGGGKIPQSDINLWSQSSTDTIEYTGPVQVKKGSVNGAFIFDGGKSRLQHSTQMVVTDRQWMNVMIDADNDQENAHFALFNDTILNIGTPVVKFRLDGGNSWIDSEQLGIGTTSPDATLDVNGNIQSEALKGQGYRPLATGNDGTIGLFNDTMMVAFSALDFQGPDQLTTNFLPGYIGVRPQESGAGEMWMSIEAINGSVFNDTIMVFLIDNGPGNLLVELMEVDANGTGGMTQIASVSSSGASPTIRELPLLLPAVNLNAREKQYYLKVSSGGWAGNNTQVLGGRYELIR